MTTPTSARQLELTRDSLLASGALRPDLGAAGRTVVDREERGDPVEEAGAEDRLDVRPLLGDSRIVLGPATFALALRGATGDAAVKPGIAVEVTHVARGRVKLQPATEDAPHRRLARWRFVRFALFERT